MKTLKFLFTILFLFAFLPTLVRAQPQYLDVGSTYEVSLPLVSGSTQGEVYFDLSEINISTPIYPDLAVVSNIL